MTTEFVRAHIAPTHLTVSDYAPPVISESNLTAVAFSYLQEIRTANKIGQAVRIRIGLSSLAAASFYGTDTAVTNNGRLFRHKTIDWHFVWRRCVPFIEQIRDGGF